MVLTGGLRWTFCSSCCASREIQCQPSCDLEVGRACFYNYRSEITRHLLLLLRLQRPYLVYCFACFLLAVAAFTSTLIGLLSTPGKGPTGARGAAHLHAIIEGGRWQTFCWAIVGLALVVEVLVGALIHGICRFVKDPWSFFDLSIIGLTAIAWALARLRHISRVSGVTPREVAEVEGADLSLLALRFILQLSRVLATFLLTRKVRQMQSNNKTTDIPAVPMAL